MGHKKKHHKEAQAPPAVRRRSLRDTAIIAVVAAVGVLIGVGWWNFNHRASESSPAVTPVNDPADGQQDHEAVPSEVRPIPSAFAKLQGKWVRADGGYVIDIKSVDKHGEMDAAYLNPNPIHVAKAKAMHDGAATKVFVELQDVNYPGSTYDLLYDAAGDQLSGVYFQAVQQQRFDVTFDRAE